MQESTVVDVVYSAANDEYTISYDNAKEDYYHEVPMLETSKEYCQYKVDEYNKKNIKNTIDRLDKEMNELQSKIDKLLLQQQAYRINILANQNELDMLNAKW